MADITLPQLGESVTEGTLGKWLKQVGDPVAKYEPLVEVVTDKVTAEVPSDYDGVLTDIVVQEGETVSVGTVICTVAAEGGASSTPVPQSSAANAPADAVTDKVTETPQKPEGNRYSPAVLRLAQDNNIDLAQLHGTGLGGRITRKDVRQYLEETKGAQRPSQPSQEAAPVQSAGMGGSVEPVKGKQVDGAATPPAAVARTTEFDSLSDEIVEPSTVRKMIAKKMVESKQTAPHAWTVVEADVTNLAGLRQKVKSDFKKKEGIDLTYLPFFIKAVAEALKQYPMLNAAWVDDKIHMRSRVNISIAVATDDALVVPVIHDADRQSIAGLAHSVNQLAAKARSGRLSIDDVQGGTFTVNNTGAFGSVLSQPIINMPQSGILSVESIVKRPVVVNDAIAIRSMVNLCFSLDHRLLDGWISGQFLKAVKDRLQKYDENTLIY
ncbi:dihydrolipoamide acetyltransferase family protein [Alicyclobacillus sp. SO9]|uniref:dihydrolipoamide acetyltransferase family protein n=1 Tax=Alicyclobacillus sp. SO9 TaxID=2665646 RepID=UPI0018E84952|nr:dihydrolipoamide acetyltransferase family protein [Alicyclobacillus sp. SO9]QQE76925.1 2-oxo acid dehydrogenase subunit E2 [Alicyclobacillus sp. SO9]